MACNPARRSFLRGAAIGGMAVRIGLPPLAAMFNASGTAYARRDRIGDRAIETRFVLWFNGNGIPEKYWIPREDRRRLRDDALPAAAGAVPRRTSTSSAASTIRRPVCPGRATATTLDERAGLRPAVHRPRRRRPVHRPGDRRRRSATNRASARCRSASARNRSARAFSAT